MNEDNNMSERDERAERKRAMANRLAAMNGSKIDMHEHTFTENVDGEPLGVNRTTQSGILHIDADTLYQLTEKEATNE